MKVNGNKQSLFNILDKVNERRNDPVGPRKPSPALDTKETRAFLKELKKYSLVQREMVTKQPPTQYGILVALEKEMIGGGVLFLGDSTKLLNAYAAKIGAQVAFGEYVQG